MDSFVARNRGSVNSSEPTGTIVHHGIDKTICQVDVFEQTKIQRVFFRNQWWWPAREVGRAIGQQDNGKQFVRNITESEAAEGIEYIRVSGNELAQVRDAISSMISSGGRFPPRETIMKSNNSKESMILLSESGLLLALLKSRTETGERMRLWLVREVLPALRRNGTYTLSNAPPIGESVAFLRLTETLVGLQSVAQHTSIAIARQTEALANLTEKLTLLERRVEDGVHAPPTLGRERSRKILDRLQNLAKHYEPNRRARAWRKKRAELDQRARKHCGLAMSVAWRDAPATVAYAVESCLKDMELDAKKHEGLQTQIPGV